MTDQMVQQALTSQVPDEVLDALSAVEAHLRELSRVRGDLMEHAKAIGVPQADLGRRLEVSQPAVSRQMRHHHEAAQDPRSRRIAEAIDGYERRRISQDRLVEELVGAGEGPMSALDRAIVRGSVPPEVGVRVQQGHLDQLTQGQRLERMDPDLLDDLMKSQVKGALVFLRDRDPQAHQDLARRARRARDTSTRIQLIAEARAILS